MEFENVTKLPSIRSNTYGLPHTYKVIKPNAFLYLFPLIPLRVLVRKEFSICKQKKTRPTLWGINFLKGCEVFNV